MAKTKETSDRVSTIAADLVNITAAEIVQIVAEGKVEIDELVRKIRLVSASAWSQDQTKGKRR